MISRETEKQWIELLKQAKEAEGLPLKFHVPNEKKGLFRRSPDKHFLVRKTFAERMQKNKRATRVIAFACDFCGKLFLEDWDAETHAETCNRRSSTEHREFVEKFFAERKFGSWDGLGWIMVDCPNPTSQRFW